MRVLIIEDDHEMAQTIKEELKQFFLVDVVHTGEEGEYQASVNEYDAIIMDYMLPGINGMEVIQKIRSTNNNTPILMLTGNSTLDVKVDSLNEGADDYLVKPFHFSELLARVRAIMRRQNMSSKMNILVVGDLVLDVNSKIVTRNGVPITLRRKELYLLEYLMRNAGQVITREMILNHVWDTEFDSLTNLIDVHIKYLRDRIDRNFDKKLIKTIHGIGYKIEA